MEEIDLNDTVTVELTEWGAIYLNVLNTYKTDYKAGFYKYHQLYQLITEFKYGIRFDKPKPFNKLKKAC